MSEPFLGEVRPYAFNFAPRGWALCNGQLLPISQNQALFSLLGTTYGGDGRVTFALPDLRGRTPIHTGVTMPLGTMTGTESRTLTTSELPAHNHTFQATSAEAILRSPSNAVPAAPVGQNLYNSATPDSINSQMIAIAGGSQPFNNMQPYLVINYCIALVGIYPSRD